MASVPVNGIKSRHLAYTDRAIGNLDAYGRNQGIRAQ